MTSSREGALLRGPSAAAVMGQLRSAVAANLVNGQSPAGALEQLDQNLSSTSKRMYADLADAASLHDRMEMIEDPIQFALEHYELATSRLTELSTANKGLILEALIVVVLLADFVVHFSELLILSGRTLFPSGAPTIIP